MIKLEVIFWRDKNEMECLCRDLLRVGSSTESSPTRSTGAQQQPPGGSAAADMDIDGKAWRDADSAPSSGHDREEVHDRPEQGKSAAPCVQSPVLPPSTVLSMPNGALNAHCPHDGH